MTPFSGLYPPRNRSTNIALIKSLLAAHTQKEFKVADEKIRINLHPSLFSELDWMEMTMPIQDREVGISLVDGLFANHLSEIILQRKVEFDLSEEDLYWEIATNVAFYRNFVYDEECIFDVLGDELSQRIRNCLQNIDLDVNEVVFRLCQSEQDKILQAFSGVEDQQWILFMVDVEIKNALAKSLDHITSRMQTKQFIRYLGGQFPIIKISSIRSQKDLQLLQDQLISLETLAREFSVYQLSAVCSVLRELVIGMDVTKLNAFSGRLAEGYGHCGKCSMMYASTAIVSLDTTCPKLFEDEDYTIFLPLDFNVSICPFCGYEQREEAPSMFYSPNRNQVIYNFPRLGQFSKKEARDVHRQTISDIRQEYINRISDKKAEKFEMASEELTYSTAEFLMAIQMGTTVKEEHIFLLLRFYDGSGLISDPTKGANICLTHNEMDDLWAPCRAVNLDEAFEDRVDVDNLRSLLQDAIEAFSARKYELSCDILEELYKKYPGDEFVRKNLAVAYVTLGDKESARKVLRRMPLS